MKTAVDISNDQVRIDDLAPRVARPAFVIGAVILLGSLLVSLRGGEAYASFLRAYIVSYSFFVSIALGALFFVLIQHLTKAGWSPVVRRIAENFLATFPLLAVLALPIVVPMILGKPAGIHDVYPWTDTAHLDEILIGKQAYLNVPFFTLRLMFYFAIWCGLGHFYYTNSVRQDATGDVKHTHRMESLSAPGIIIFSLTLTFFSFDVIMSLDPHWFSTIFGVYFFAGSTVSFYCVLAMTMFWLQRIGRLSKSISEEHYHDVGKLMFAFMIFWAYIAFSQYMLIWYANIPEEIPWYLVRHQHPWVIISLLLLFGHFMAPFVLLISRIPKRKPVALVVMALWILAMHWFDIFWLVMPRIDHAASTETLVAASLTNADIINCALSVVGIGGLFIWATVRKMGQAALIPQRDPRLDESLAFENF